MRELSADLRRFMDKGNSPDESSGPHGLGRTTDEAWSPAEMEPESIVLQFHSYDYRVGFRRLAALVENLHQRERLSDWAGVHLAEVLAAMLHIGRKRAAGLLDEAGLPASVSFAELGAGDVPRFAAVLRHYAGRGLTRDAPGAATAPERRSKA